LMENSERVVPIEVRDGVAIDRDTGTVSGPRKYDFEVVPPGVTFNLEVFVENPRDWGMGLLVAGFDQLDLGFTALGGFGSRGLGRVRISWERVERFTARDLLSGKQPEKLDLKAQREVWAESLRTYVEGH